MIVVTGELIRQQVTTLAVNKGDRDTIKAFGSEADTWLGSTGEKGKVKAMMTLLNGIANAITGGEQQDPTYHSISSQTTVRGVTGDFNHVKSNSIRSVSGVIDVISNNTIASNAISGISGDFDNINSDNINTNTIDTDVISTNGQIGISYNITIVTTIGNQYYGYKTRTLSFNKGILTQVSQESDWIPY